MATLPSEGISVVANRTIVAAGTMKVTIKTDGTVVTDFGDDKPGAVMTDEVLSDRLRDPQVGADVLSSMRAVLAIVGRLRARRSVSADVDHTLGLISKAASAAMGAHCATITGRPIESEYTRDVLAAELVLDGKATRGKRDVHVEDSLWQQKVVAALDSEQVSYTKASSVERPAIIARTRESIFGITGRRPSEAMTREALEAQRRKPGRPRGRKGSKLKKDPSAGRLTRPELVVYCDLLREIGLESASPEALDKARRRRRRKVDK